MDVKVVFKSGGSFVQLRPQFLSNSETICVAWKNKILAYNTKTGKLLAEFKGIKDRIVGFSVHFYQSIESITACSSSGEVITWKIATHFKIINKKLEVDQITAFHRIATADDEIKALISYKHQGVFNLALCDLNSGFMKNYNLKLNLEDFYMDVCADKYFAIAQRSKLYISDFKGSKPFNIKIEKGRRFTCISCHPEDELVLTGDNLGRVLVWQNIFSHKPTQASFHWHTLPVKCVGFSEAGSHFYSGGDECVLVQWQQDNPLEKKFLPRLPASIQHVTVSPGNLYIAIAMNDNAVRIVDSRLEKISLIQHLVVGDQLKSGIVLDARTKALVMNGNVGYIQFYSPNDNSLLYNVDVVGQNKISNERDCKMESTEVTKIAVCKNGLWMATVEKREDTEFSADLRLKFWNFDLKIQNYKLNTSIEYPHDKDVNAISFQPTNKEGELKCVSVGEDKKFKIWQLTDASTIYSKSSAWKCMYTGYYRNLPCRSLSFSVDGSLVAISFNNIVTTWLPDSCILKCSLTHPSFRSEIRQVQFGINNQCHLLVAASCDRLNVWNLLTLTMMWTVSVNVSLLIADTVSTNMAVFTKDKKVFLFEPSSPDPVFSSDGLLTNSETICAAAFVPSKHSNDTRMTWYQRSPIYFIDSNNELFCFGTDEENNEPSTFIEDTETSLFSKMLPKAKSNKTQAVETVQHMFIRDAAQRNFKKYLEAPLHTMLPIRLVCGSILRAMILQKPS